MPILDIPETDRLGILLIRDLPEEAFADLLVQLDRSPKRVPTIAGVGSEDAQQLFNAIKNMYRVRLYADVSVEEFVTDVHEALLEYKTIGQQDIQRLEPRLSRLLNIDSVAIASKAALLRLEYEHRYCTARILTDARPIFGSDVSAPPEAMLIAHNLRISYHEDEGEDTKEIYFALRGRDLAELRELIDRAETKEKSLRAALSTTKIKMLDAPEK